MTTTEAPRIYVASLADYNAGRLHGRWIDLIDMTLEDIYDEIGAMLKNSQEPFAEEWEIDDWEGMPRPIGRLGLTAIHAYVAITTDMTDLTHEAFDAYIAHVGPSYFAQTPEAVHDEFESCFLGVYDDKAEFAADYANTHGMIDLDTLANSGIVIDWETTAEGWESDWLAFAEHSDGIAAWSRI